MTQKRGLGRGLGALIPGAGSTSAPEQELRTRTRPADDSEDRSGSTRPVDMFFSGERVDADGRAQRGRGDALDLATGMARAAAERRGRTAGTARTSGAGAKQSTTETAESKPASRSSKAPQRSSRTAADAATSEKPAAKSAAAKKPAPAKSAASKAGTTKSSASKAGASKSTATKSSTTRSTATKSTASGTAASKNSAAKRTATKAEEPTGAAAQASVAENVPAKSNPAEPAAAASTPSQSAGTAPVAARTGSGQPAAEEKPAESTTAPATTSPATDSAEDSPAVDVEPVAPAPADEASSESAPAESASQLEPVASAQERPPAQREPAPASVQEDDAASALAAAGQDLVSVPGAVFAEIPIHEVRENPRNPRTMFDEDELDELAYSLREVGVLQPVVVRPIPVTEDGESFELVMGERRWRAARRAGLTAVPAIIRETSDDDLLRDALLENLHRTQLNPLEEANAYQQLLEDFGCTQDELGERIGRSRPQITNTLRLLRLPALVQRRLASGAISAGHARALLSLDDPHLMEELAQRIVQEGLSVRAVERLVASGGQQAAPRTVRRSTYDPHVVDLTSRLSNRLEAPVRIDVGKRKGRITLEFTNLEDLERLVENMGLDVPLPPGDH